MPMLMATNHSSNSRIKQKTMATMVFNDPETSCLLEGKSELLTSVNSTLTDESVVIPSTATAPGNANKNLCNSGDHASQIQQHYSDCNKTPAAIITTTTVTSCIGSQSSFTITNNSQRSPLIYDECSSSCRLSPSLTQMSGPIMGGNPVFNINYISKTKNTNTTANTMNTSDNNLLRGGKANKIGCNNQEIRSADITNTLDEREACYSVVRKIPASKSEPNTSGAASSIPFSAGLLSSPGTTRFPTASALRKQTPSTSSGNDVTSANRQKTTAPIVSQVAPAEVVDGQRNDINGTLTETEMNSSLLRSLLGNTQVSFANTGQKKQAGQLVDDHDPEEGNVFSRSSEFNDPGDGLGPLPLKWETAYTERGEMYFIDHNTGTSHWLDPRLSKYQKKSLEECSEDELPYGWEKIEDSLYGTYYIDHVKRKTQYENPVLEAKRRAAEQGTKQQLLSRQRPQQQSPLLQAPHQRSWEPSSPNAINITQRAMQPTPNTLHQLEEPQNHNRNLIGHGQCKFTRNPNELEGKRLSTSLVKSNRGLGLTIIGGDNAAEEFLQIKSLIPHGPAWLDGQLQTGDVLVYVNGICLLGFSHLEMVDVFQSIKPGETVTLDICRGYPLPFDPNDPNTEVVTTIAVDGLNLNTEKKSQHLLSNICLNNDNYLSNSSNKAPGEGNISGLNIHDEKNNIQIASETDQNHHVDGGVLDTSGFILMKKPEIYIFPVVKNSLGFDFTVKESPLGPRIQKIFDHGYCISELEDGDTLLAINDIPVNNRPYIEVLQLLQNCPKSETTRIKIQRIDNSRAKKANVNISRRSLLHGTGLFRSKTPTADLYSSMQKEILPMRPKTPLVDTRKQRLHSKIYETESHNDCTPFNFHTKKQLPFNKFNGCKTRNSLTENEILHANVPFMENYSGITNNLCERLSNVVLPNTNLPAPGLIGNYLSNQLRTTASGIQSYENNSDYVSTCSGNYSSIYGLSQMPPTMSPLNGSLYGPLADGIDALSPPITTYNHHHRHHDSCFCRDCQEYRDSRLRRAGVQSKNTNVIGGLQATHIQNDRMQKRVNELLNDRRRITFTPNSDLYTKYNNSTNAVVTGNHSSSPVQQHSPAISSISQSINCSISGASGTINYDGGNNNPSLPIGNAQKCSEFLGVNGGILDSDNYGTSPYVLTQVTLQRQKLGFGFRIVGGTEEGSQVTVGHIVAGGAADNDHRINTGDEILSIDGINVVNSSHHKVVSLMGDAALRGQVTMILRRRTEDQQGTIMSGLSSSLSMAPNTMHELNSLQDNNSDINTDAQQIQSTSLINPTISHSIYPYDVIVSRNDNESFGFVIISSSNQYYGSTIGKLIPESPADRCDELRVGDRIVAVNRVDITGMPHGDVVNLIKESGLHVRLTIGCPKEGAIINATRQNVNRGSSSSNLEDAVRSSPPSQLMTPQSPLPEDYPSKISDSNNLEYSTVQMLQQPSLSLQPLQQQPQPQLR